MDPRFIAARLGIVFGCALGANLVACSPAAHRPASSPTVDGETPPDAPEPTADIEAPTEAPAALAETPPAPPAEKAAAVTAAPPPTSSSAAYASYGSLLCRSERPIDGTAELYLSWDGDEGKGMLRTVAPSGEEHEDRVIAERGNGLVLVSAPHETDLMKHAAIVAQRNGKTYIRLGDAGAAWSTCSK